MAQVKQKTPRTPRVALVVSKWNEEITSGLLDGAIRALRNAGIVNPNIVEVPGAIEIPLICQALARTKKVDGIVAIGAVIKGETAHFEYVSKIAMDGIRQVMLVTGIPIGCGILTTFDEAQAI